MRMRLFGGCVCLGKYNVYTNCMWLKNIIYYIATNNHIKWQYFMIENKTLHQETSTLTFLRSAILYHTYIYMYQE